MAKKPVNLCMNLRGEDARDFNTYMNNPGDITPKGRDMLKKARIMASKMSLDEL